MPQPPNTRRVLVSVADAAVRLGISQTEVRRQVKAGRLEAESFDRPQGSYIRVVFYEPEAAPLRADQEAPPTRQDAPDALLPTLEALIASHERLAEAYQRIAALEREAGTYQADARHTTARAEAAESERDRLRAELVDAQHVAESRAEALEWVQGQLDQARRPWWRRLLG